MTLIQALQMAALICSGLFAGAAIYINLAEHPARIQCGAAEALRQFVPSYRRAARMQAPLALLGFIAGTAIWLLGAGWFWLLGALLVGSVVPYTYIMLMGINRQLLATASEHADDRTLALLHRWNRRHMARSLAGASAFVIFATAVIQS